MAKLEGAGNPRELVAKDLKDFNGDALTPESVESITVIVYNSDLSVVAVTERAMAWSEVDQDFAYVWDTTGVAAGTYKWFAAWVTIDGLPGWAGPIRLRVAADPRPA